VFFLSDPNRLVVSPSCREGATREGKTSKAPGPRLGGSLALPVEQDAPSLQNPEAIRMIEQLPEGGGKVLGFRMSGKLHDEDYKKFVPLVDEAIAAQGKVRMLALFEDFHGWDLHALWDDVKFATTHCTKIERIALVGDKAWEAWMARVCKPFTMAKVQYFDSSKLGDAWTWIKEGV
jgi:hypothetical protein